MWTPKNDLQVLLPQCLRDHACTPLRQIHVVWQRGLCSLPHAELFEAGRFLTSSGPGRAWVLGPGSAWVRVLAPIESRPVRISLLVFGTYLPSDFSLFRWNPTVRLARSRNCSLFMFRRSSASGTGKELAVPGSSLQDAAPRP